jgi:hypothetical protein
VIGIIICVAAICGDSNGGAECGNCDCNGDCCFGCCGGNGGNGGNVSYTNVYIGGPYV